MWNQAGELVVSAIIASLAVEAITQILTKSSLLDITGIRPFFIIRAIPDGVPHHKRIVIPGATVKSRLLIWFTSITDFSWSLFVRLMHKLLTCGYCTSVWVSFSIAVFLTGAISGWPLIDLLIRWMVVHRLSNIVHDVIEKHRRGMVNSIDLTVSNLNVNVSRNKLKQSAEIGDGNGSVRLGDGEIVEELD